MSMFRAPALIWLAAASTLVAASSVLKAEQELAPAGIAPNIQFTGYEAAQASELSACDAADGCPSLTETCCDCPLWSVQAGAVILARTARSTVLLEDTVTGNALLSAGDFSVPWAAGPDVSVRRWFDGGDALDVRFFAVDGWNSRTSVTTTPIWNFPTNPPLFGLGVADVSVFYATRFYSTEVNWNRPANEWLTWLVGFRWIELYENLGYNADFGGNFAQVNFQSANRLYGGQAGADVALLERGAVRVNGLFKAGIYGNAATSGMLVSQAIGPDFAASDKSGQVAFVGDLGIVAAYQWTDNIALRAGYQLLWLDGVALAPDQVSATQVIAGNGIDTKGDAFYHGALVGIDVTW